MRPSASTSATVSVSPTAVTREAIRPTASSTDISGPPNAKQSSESCAMTSAFGHRQHVLDRNGVAPHHGGDRADIVEMGDGEPGFNRDIGSDADDIRVGRKQERLAVLGTMHLDLAMRLGLVALDHDEVDARQLLQQHREMRLALAAQLMHQRPAITRRDQ